MRARWGVLGVAVGMMAIAVALLGIALTTRRLENLFYSLAVLFGLLSIWPLALAFRGKPPAPRGTVGIDLSGSTNSEVAGSSVAGFDSGINAKDSTNLRIRGTFLKGD